MGNLSAKMIFSCRDCTTALDMPPTNTHTGMAGFDVDERAMCDGCADRLAELGFKQTVDTSGLTQVICPHIAEDWSS